MKKIKKSLESRGFTLVELMVVVAIIGILASVALPAFNKQQAKARQAEGRVALSSFYMAAESFLVDEGYDVLNTATLTQLSLDAFDPANSGSRYFMTRLSSTLDSGIPGRAVAAVPASGSIDSLSGVDASSNTYTIGTIGNISGQGNCYMGMTNFKVMTVDSATCPVGK
ncbi:MAG: prepilin-type N-terminal cleavage/methylation domain-containing protein [Halobacteriovoraceae bacterium]|nr:prepilin-type N-terminal cleavage/methylation domain-containing protein [Halobacteriovoraceae bacterium]